MSRSEKEILCFTFLLGALIGVFAALAMLFFLSVISEGAKADDGAAGATSSGRTHIRIVVPERITLAAAAAPGALEVVTEKINTPAGTVLVYSPSAK